MNQYKDSQGNVFDEDQLRIKAQEQGIEFGEFLVDFQRVGSIKTEGTVEGKEIKQPEITEVETTKPKKTSINPDPKSFSDISIGNADKREAMAQSLASDLKKQDQRTLNDFIANDESNYTKSIKDETEKITIETNAKFDLIDDLFNTPKESRQVKSYPGSGASGMSMAYSSYQKPIISDQVFYTNPITGKKQREKPFEKDLKKHTEILNSDAKKAGVSVEKYLEYLKQPDIESYARDKIIQEEIDSKRGDVLSSLDKGLEQVELDYLNDIRNKKVEKIEIKKDEVQKVFNLKTKSLVKELDDVKNTPAAKWFNDFIEMVNQPLIMGPNEGEGTFDFKRQDGKIVKVPNSYLNEYQVATSMLSENENDIRNRYKIAQEEYDKSVPNPNDKKQLLQEINLLGKNYNNFSKNYNKATMQSRLMMAGALDMMTVGLNEDVGEWQRNLRIERQSEVEKFSNDIRFDQAFDSLGNFGEFLGQELGTQLPIIASMIATGGIAGVPAFGLGALAQAGVTGGVMMLTSGGQQLGDMNYEEEVSKQNEYTFDDVEYSTFQKFWMPIGYGAAEGVFGAMPTAFIGKRAIESVINAGGKKLVKEVSIGFNRVTLNRITNEVAMPMLFDATGEAGFTAPLQSLITGRPLLEDVKHAGFTSLMFTGSMTTTSVAAGAVLNKFSDPKTDQEIRSLINDKEIIERNRIYNIANLGEIVYDDQIAEIKKINKSAELANARIDNQLEIKFRGIDQDIRNLGEDDFNRYVQDKTEYEKIKGKAQEIYDGNDLPEIKDKKLKDLKIQFDFYQEALDSFTNQKDFGNPWFLLQTASITDDEAKERLDKIKKEATDNLLKDNPNKELKESEILEEGEKIYKEQEIDKDVNNLKNNSKKSFLASSEPKVYENVEEAKKAFDDEVDEQFKARNKRAKLEERPEITKEEFIDQQYKIIETSNGFARVRRKTAEGEELVKGDRSQIVLIKEKMRERGRLRTGVHEVSHLLLFEALALGQEATNDTANELMRFLYLTNRAEHDRMFRGLEPDGKINTKRLVERNEEGKLISEEVIVNFMEAVAEGRIDLSTVQNSVLTKALGKHFNAMLEAVTGKKKTINWKGEKDVISFISEMALSLENGTLSKEDFDAIKKDRTIIKNDIEVKNEKVISSKVQLDDEDKKSDISEENKKIASEINEIYDNKTEDANWVYDIFLKETGTVEKAIKDLPEAISRGNEEDLRSEYGAEILQIIDNYDDRSRKITIDKNENQGINSGKTTLSVTYNKQSGDVRINKVKYKELKNASEQQIINFIEKNTKGKVLESKKIPISGYIQLAKSWRFLEVNKRILPQKFQISTDDVNFERSVSGDLNFQTTQEDISKTSDDIKVETQRVGGLIDPKSLIDEELVDQAKENIFKKLKETPLSGLTFKSLLDLSPETTGAVFGIPESDASLKNNTKLTPTWPEAEANGISFKEFKLTYTLKKLLPITNLTNKEYVNAALALDKMYDGLSKILPQGAIREKEVRVELYGTSAGLPNNILKALYEKQDRKGQNLAPFVLAPLTREKFRTAIGLLPDGKPSNNMTNRMSEHQTTKGLISLFGKLLTNTTVRQELQKIPGTEQAISDIAAGKSEYMRSFISNELIQNQIANEKFFTIPNGDWSSLKTKDQIAEFWNKNFNGLFINEDVNELAVKALEKEADKYDKNSNESLGEYLKQSIESGFKRVEFAEVLGLTEYTFTDSKGNAVTESKALNFDSEVQQAKAREGLAEIAKKLEVEEINRWLLPMVTKGSTASGLGTGLTPVSKNKFTRNKDKKRINYILATGRLDFFNNILKDDNRIGSYISPKRKIDEYPIISAFPTSNSKQDLQEFIGKNYNERILRRDDNLEGLIKISEILTDLAADGTIDLNTLGMIGMTLTSNADALIKSAAAPTIFIKNKEALDNDLKLMYSELKKENTEKAKSIEKYFTKKGEVRYIYEHAMPGRDAAVAVLNIIKNKKTGDIGAEINAALKNFEVAIIPSIVDAQVNRYYKDSSPVDGNGLKIPFSTDSNGNILVPRYNDSLTKDLLDKEGYTKHLNNFTLTREKPKSFPDTETNRSSDNEVAMPLSDRFNSIIEETKGKKNKLASANKIIPEVIARQKGATIGKYSFFVPPSADDFMGLMYAFMGESSRGELHGQFFEETLNKPYKRGIAQLESAKQKIESDYKDLRKKYPKLSKKLGKKMPDSDFTYDQAIRIWLWKSGGFDMKDTGLEPDKAEGRKLINDAFFAVAKDREMQQFARQVGLITKQEKGYIEPGRDWLVDNIASDLNSISDKIGRKQFLQEFTNNYKEIFNSQNLNKIEAIYGTRFKQSLEDILFRMEKGTNRNFGSEDARANAFADFLNGSVGTIMFFNSRSAALQTLSAANYVNWSDNNLLKAGTAFANQPQYWRDVVTLFNSDKLKQRRKGFKIDVNQAELANSVEGSTDSYKKALRFLLKIGFTPTQAADGLAISTGGATFYRNRAKTYEKQGWNLEEAEAKAFEDFSELTDKHQQSSDPSMVSEQQANKFSRFVLSFQNTSMQYNRMMKKAALDLANRRGNPAENVSKIVYYGFAQNFIFNSLSSALFAMSFDDEEEVEKKEIRVINSMVDTVLKGSGYHGAIAAMVKNTAFEVYRQESKDYGIDYAYVGIAIANVAPSIGSKFRKAYQIKQTIKYNKDLIKERGFYPGTLNPTTTGKKESFGFKGASNTFDNPAYMIGGLATSVFTNIPLDRAVKKVSNLTYVLDESVKAWQKLALLFGWGTYDLGVKNSDGVLIKERAQDKRRKVGYQKSKQTRRKKKSNTDALLKAGWTED